MSNDVANCSNITDVAANFIIVVTIFATTTTGLKWSNLWLVSCTLLRPKKRALAAKNEKLRHAKTDCNLNAVEISTNAEIKYNEIRIYDLQLDLDKVIACLTEINNGIGES